MKNRCLLRQRQRKHEELKNPILGSWEDRGNDSTQKSFVGTPSHSMDAIAKHLSDVSQAPARELQILDFANTECPGTRRIG